MQPAVAKPCSRTTGARAPYRNSIAGATRTGVQDRFPDRRRARKPHHPRRHADPGRTRDINYHIVATIKMLEALPWPKHLKNVPEYAGGHHERMDGKGYPKGLKRDEMSVQARMMGIADIFEALTAPQTGPTSGMKLSQAKCHFSSGILNEGGVLRLLNGHIEKGFTLTCSFVVGPLRARTRQPPVCL
jgi:hypothetical protein